MFDLLDALLICSFERYFFSSAGEESLDAQGKLLQFAFYMQEEGLAESAAEKSLCTMKRFTKIDAINDTESVKAELARLKIEETTKSTYCAVYA